MKKLLLALFALPAMVFAQGTTINFDDPAKWTMSGTNTSYGSHTYVDGIFTMVGTNIYREYETTLQHSEPRTTSGIHAIRLRDQATNVKFTIATGGISDFSFQVRRWDNSPAINYNVYYSIDGGVTTHQLDLIDDDFVNNESAFVNYSGTINSVANNIVITVERVSGERLIIDDFSWSAAAPATSCTISTANLTGVTCDNNGTPTVTNDDNIKFTLNPTAVLGATTYNVTVPAGYTVSPTSASYGAATEFTLSGAGNGAVVVTITDADDQDCTVDVTVEDPGICSSATPVLTTSVNTLALANYTLPFAATQGQFTFTGLTLAGDVTVAVTGNFEISKDNVTFANTLTYPLGSETAMTDSVVYVRSTATAAGVNAGTITVSSSNATDATVAVSTTVDAYAAKSFADAKTLTEGGTPVNINQKVIITGTTNCTNFYNNTRYNFYLLDENQEGIYIYRNPSFAYYTFNSGDSLRIYGKVAFFNGLTQIVPDSITLVGAATFTDFTPVVLDGPMVEAHESNYMIIEDVAFATPQTNWPTNGNVTVVKGGIEYEVRIVSANPLSGTAAPTTPTFSMVGYVSQYATVAPYTTGYQFFPCGNEGIIEGEVVPCANPATGEVTYDATTGIITATDVDASYSYQWIACGPDAPEFPEIMFQTAQTFQVTSSGSYAVRVANSNPGCSLVESECLEIEVDDSAVDNVLAASTMVYPNPFNTSLTIVSEKAVSYTVVDVQGKTIATTQSINGKVSVNTESWLQGVYFIQLVGANAETHTVKVIK